MAKITIVLDKDEKTGMTSIKAESMTQRELIAVASVVMFTALDRGGVDSIKACKDIGDRI